MYSLYLSLYLLFIIKNCNTRHSDGSPDPDGLYDEFIRFLFLYAHRQTSVLDNELPEESDQFRFLRSSCFANLKGVVGLIMSKESDMRISISLDLSSRSFIPLPCFIRSCRPTPFLDPSVVLFPQCSD